MEARPAVEAHRSQGWDQQQKKPALADNALRRVGCSCGIDCSRVQCRRRGFSGSLRGRVAGVEGEEVRSFRNVDEEIILAAWPGIVFSQLRPETAGLDAHGGIQVRVEVSRAAENLGGNLVFLGWRVRRVDHLL